MKSIKDYNSGTPTDELWRFLAERIVAGEITTFSELLEAVKELPRDRIVVQTCVDLFPLIRQLNWGFFSGVTREAYPKIWQEIVIPHPQLKDCGNLKRNLTISDIYVGILDLHGYTAFCEKNKNNLSMLQLLDDVIQTDMAKIAQEHNVVLQRHAGDEMVLVAASVVDILTVTLLIVGYFAKKKAISVDGEGASRSGNSIVLEDMHISAGIAGGKKFTPFIITKDGDLSGGVINTAARLQARANALSGNRTRILITRTVFTSFTNEIKGGLPPQFRQTPVSFFDSGWIRFKGISLALNEVLYDPADQYKLSYERDMSELYKSVETHAWKDGLFVNLLQLLIRIYKNMPAFKVNVHHNGSPSRFTNESFIFLASRCLKLFQTKTSYDEAVDKLEELLDMTRGIPDFDSLALEYAETIFRQYRMLGNSFRAKVADKVRERAPALLPPSHRSFYENSAKNEAIKAKLESGIRESMTAQELYVIWNNLIDEQASSLDVSIWSGKK